MNKLATVVLLGTAFAGQAGQSQDAHNYQYTEIRGKKLAYACQGQGKVTALLVAGMGLDAHTTYKNTLHNANPEGYRLCFYDRAGYGKSQYENPKVRTMVELRDELAGLIEHLKVESLVLVPHSFGGFVARAYASKYPDKVKGMVLIDTAHESWFDAMKSNMSKPGWGTMEMIINWEREHNSFEDFAEASSHSALYKIKDDLPVTVLSRGIPHVTIRQTKMSYADIDVYTQTWNDSQKKLAKLNNNTQAVTMKYASHLFDETDPWIALEHIEAMVNKAKL
ncbi:alpha/beta hydrolase [Pseudoalteromonas sp. DL2-H2.2]|uniref:alpha/beta fold hydrolase n=1 Tax=Pseudoalteromonas sp. DL2-H2.2 TaxID=2908889 RepID=UPI001F2C6109|nr:alpha/beta hydrolase [Pseudoalteromonas sp. DL2-H2.2]MCF2909498.1 alpha/beta hydrolase [Pseudoalteromonas sp. DL2-H2.2]